LGSVIVAFSGGVDSGLLCAAAYAALGDRMLAVTVRSPIESMGEVASAQALAEQVGFLLRVLDYDNLNKQEFVSNPPDRCYICKLARFRLLPDLAVKEGFAALHQSVSDFFKSLGFHYVAVDLTGYRLGSLNEVLK
jgi:pyridinium-3,5-biscarboxylic acid mononucleotide sulfurtransferase